MAVKRDIYRSAAADDRSHVHLAGLDNGERWLVDAIVRDRVREMRAEIEQAQVARPDWRDEPPVLTHWIGGIEVIAEGMDRPSGYRRQHDAAEPGPHRIGKEEIHAYRTQPDPIDRYHARREITAAQYRAACRLRIAFDTSGLTPRVVASYAEPSGGAREWDDVGPRQIEARARYVMAIESVGPILAPVLRHVVCDRRTASDYAASKGARGRRAATEGITTLKLALDALKANYGL